MASITMLPIVPTRGRVFAATKGTGGSSKEEKGLLDWIIGGLAKEDQLLETDPLLKKVEEKNSRGTTSRGGTTSNKGGTTSSKKGTTSGGKNSVVVPQKKKGGFGGFFSKD